MSEERLAGLLLAAGGSERLGRTKQLLTLDGESLVHKAASLLVARASQVVVVTGAEGTRVGDELADLPVTLVHNVAWQAGMGGSIASGVEALGEEVDGVLVMLCDQWRIGLPDLDALCTAWNDQSTMIAAASWNETYGPPAIFPRRLFGELKQLRGDSGAKGLIGRQPTVCFENIPNARFDVDTLADVELMVRFADGTGVEGSGS